MTDQTQLIPFPDNMRRWFCKIVARLAGYFALLEKRTRQFNFNYRGIISLLADRWIGAHD
jgi:hypothetical protein